MSQIQRPIAPNPRVIATVSLTGQQASIATTSIVVTPPPGVYRFSAVIEVTQAATTSSSISVTIGYTAAAATSISTTTQSGNTVGTNGRTSSVVRILSGDISYATTYASSGATPMQYALNIVIERVG